MKILVVDVGGSHVKLLASGHRVRRRVPSGPGLTPEAMADAVREAAGDWCYEAVSIGYPGPVAGDRILAEPVNLGRGWTTFDFAAAFGCPVRLVNDAAMQALGSYEGGGRMLFLGLGTGLGTALVMDAHVVPLEMGHLPYRNGRSFEEVVGRAGLDRMGKSKWRRHVTRVVGLLRAATVADYVVLGGGNARLVRELPPDTRRGSNVNAFKGGFRLWKESAR